MIEERIGEVRVKVRTDLPDAAQIRPVAERIVRAVLERCAAVLEARTPGRVVLIRRLPLKWRFDESMLDEPAQVEELAQSAADAIERTAVASPWLDSVASPGEAVLFDDEAHLRASYLLALARGRPAWFHAVIEESEPGDPLASLANPNRRSIAHATLARLAREDVLAEVLAAQPAAAVAVLAAALGCGVQRTRREPDAALGSVERTLIAELADAASGWPTLGPAAQSLALMVHAAVLLDADLDATATRALAAAALQPSSVPRAEPAPDPVDEAPREARAIPVDDTVLDEPAREEPTRIVATRCAGLFYLLDRVQELDLAESLWRACLPEGDVLAAAAAALLGARFADDSAPIVFGGVEKESGFPKVTVEQHAEVATATCAAMAAALPRRGLADLPLVVVSLAEHPAGRLLVAAADGSPFAFFAWPAQTAETLRAGLNALLETWPYRGSLEASPALVTLDTSGRLRPWEAPPKVALFLPGASSVPGAALLAMTAGAPAMLFAARAGETPPATVEVFVERRLARPGRLRITSTGLDVVLDADDIDLDVRRAALDRDPGWLAWQRRTVRFVFEAREPARGEPS
jgi:hypothetical protein